MGKISLPVLTLGLATVLLAGRSQAQVPDHLQCFKIKTGTAKAAYVADITPDDVTFPAAADCEIKVPAKLLCVDAVKSGVTPTPPGADEGAAGQKYLCYKAKCPKIEPTTSLTDQFGTHSVTVKSTSLVCAPVPTAATCSDALTNGDETDVDCGGSCPDCALGQNCGADTDCVSSYCLAGVCSTPPTSCSDMIQNGSETDVDCGGGSCPLCGPGEGCGAASDCNTGVCQAGTCQMPTCSDAVQNGTESDVDCGGGTCPPCADGSSCATAMDCVSGTCSGGICVTLLGNGSPCSNNPQCASFSCVDGVCCDTACNGTCQACTAASKGAGVDGTCGNIAGGTDPDSECAGDCDGMGMCTP